jgi:hypothetical protein
MQEVQDVIVVVAAEDMVVVAAAEDMVVVVAVVVEASGVILVGCLSECYNFQFHNV